MPNDFSNLDFTSLWNGREKVSKIEKSIIMEFLGGKRPTNILEVGCGEGRLLDELKKVSDKLYAVDLETKFLEKIHLSHSDILTIKADINSLPFRKGYFDVIIMVRVLNFLQNMKETIENLSGYLKSGGILIISFYQLPSIAYFLDRFYTLDADPSESVNEKRGSSRVRRSNFVEFFYAKSMIKQAASSAGLTITDLDSTGLGDYIPFKWLDIPAIRIIEKLTAPLSFPPHIFAVLQNSSFRPPVGQEGPFECKACGKIFPGYPSENDIISCSCGSALVNKNGIITYKENKARVSEEE